MGIEALDSLVYLSSPKLTSKSSMTWGIMMALERVICQLYLLPRLEIAGF